MTSPEYRVNSGTSGGRVSFCTVQMPSKSDEDRFSYSLSPDDENDLCISSFGMFDGHGGNYAGEKLSECLHQEVMSRYNKAVMNEKNYKIGEKLFNVDKIDTIFCESFRLAAADIDKLIRQESAAGSTQVSLFVFALPDGSTRCLCPWIGDSRCVMFQVVNGKEAAFSMSYDHKPSLDRERRRIENRESIEWTGEPIEITTHGHDPILNDDSLNGKKVSPIRELPGQFEDVEEFDYTNYDITTAPFNKSAYGSGLDDSTHGTVNPKALRLRTSSSIDDSIHGRPIDDEARDETKLNEPRPPDSTESPGPPRDMKSIPRFKSFIDRRSLPGSKVKNGPQAVFGRYGTSLAMTRSFGDRYGPRSCVAIPDVTATTIPPNTHARFVIASDGLWDVISIEKCRMVCLIIDNPRTAAYKLARMAWDIRNFNELRMDDITVIIVDINFANFTQATVMSAGCNCNIS